MGSQDADGTSAGPPATEDAVLLAAWAAGLVPPSQGVARPRRSSGGDTEDERSLAPRPQEGTRVVHFGQPMK